MYAMFARSPDVMDPVEDVRGLVTRRRILNAARELLRVQNYRSFSMEGVAGLSGLSRRTVYNLFADRDALYHASRADLLREFDPLLPICAPRCASLRASLEEFCRQALMALGTAGHRELLASVRRDGACVPWLTEFYEARVDVPLVETLGQVLRVDWHRDDERGPIRHAQRAVVLLRAAVSEPDAPPALNAHEFAHIIEARLDRGTVRRELEPRPDATARPVIDASIEQSGEPSDPGRRPIIKRGAVTISFDPVDASWNGIRVSLSPLEAEVLALVARRGRAPWADIEQVLRRCGASAESRDVLVYRLRRKFADIGAADPLETVRGWGLRFRAEQDSRGSRTVWIGASETSGEMMEVQRDD